jgi:hypothetical protein
VRVATGAAANRPEAAGFFGSHWRGEACLNRLYWRDMLIVGSVINCVSGFIALMIAAQGGALWAAAVVHFASVPYNVFLVVSLWRTPGHTKVMAWTSLVWLGAVTLI